MVEDGVARSRGTAPELIADENLAGSPLYADVTPPAPVQTPSGTWGCFFWCAISESNDHLQAIHGLSLTSQEIDMQHTFNTAQIITGDHIGAWFADGTYMLERQGCSATIRGQLGQVWIEVNVCHNERFYSKLYYEASSHPFTRTGNIAHQSQGTYSLHYANDLSKPLLPARLITETLDWAEVQTGKRPAGIRQQVHAYMFGFHDLSTHRDKDDILLIPFRYDSTVQSVLDIDGKIVAHLSQFEEKGFSSKNVEIMSTAPSIKDAFDKALRIGFHQCDTNRGGDFCMRRLTWLASQYHLKEFTPAGEIRPVFVLSNDAETPTVLALHDATSVEPAHS